NERCARIEPSGFSGTSMHRVSRERILSLERSQIVHDVPPIRLLDAVVGRHETSAIADDSEEIAIGVAGSRIRRGSNCWWKHSVLHHRAVAESHGAVAHRAVDLKLNASAADRGRISGHRV